MKIRKNLGFTLVELIIVIAILSILATISFISIGNYAAQSRDTVRLSDLKILERALNLIQMEIGVYPLPLNSGDPEEIEGIEGVKWKKGKFGEEQYLAVKRLDKLPIDPSSKEAYDYYLSENGLYYRLESKKELNGEKIIVTNYTVGLENGNSSTSTNETESSLNIPPTAILYGNIEEITSCNKDAGDRFTIIEDLIIKDNLTGLYWENNPLTISLSIEEAKARCANLILGGYSDWRVPSITELRSIVNYSCSNPSIYDGFNLTSKDYWTSIVRSDNLSSTWSIHFLNGITVGHVRGHVGYIICVR